MIEFEERRRWNGNGHLLVIGPGAAGKSTLGADLAPMVNRPLFDLDLEFGRRNGQIDAFINAEGYERYKFLNSALADEIITSSECEIILVTSSGFLTPDNPPAALRSNLSLLAASYSVCLLPSRDLERTVSIIVGRQLQRPFASDHIREEKTIRSRFLYMALGDLIVFSETSTTHIAKAVVERLQA